MGPYSLLLAPTMPAMLAMNSTAARTKFQLTWPVALSNTSNKKYAGKMRLARRW